MNTVGSKGHCRALLLAILTALIPAPVMSAIPVESIRYYQPDTEADQVAITGVLGYTADCKLAVYGDREAAVMRTSVEAVPLPGAKLAVGGDKASPERLVGSYVIADGKLTKGGTAFILRDARVTYAFGQQVDENSCVAITAPFVPLSALLARRGDFDSQEIWTIGLAQVAHDGGVALFLNLESAANNVWTQKIQVVSRVDSSQIRSCISASGSSYVAIRGTVMRVAGPGNSRALSRIKSCLRVGN